MEGLKGVFCTTKKPTKPAGETKETVESSPKKSDETDKAKAEVQRLTKKIITKMTSLKKIDATMFLELMTFRRFMNSVYNKFITAIAKCQSPEITKECVDLIREAYARCNTPATFCPSITQCEAIARFLGGDKGSVLQDSTPTPIPVIELAAGHGIAKCLLEQSFGVKFMACTDAVDRLGFEERKFNPYGEDRSETAERLKMFQDLMEVKIEKGDDTLDRLRDRVPEAALMILGPSPKILSEKGRKRLESYGLFVEAGRCLATDLIKKYLAMGGTRVILGGSLLFEKGKGVRDGSKELIPWLAKISKKMEVVKDFTIAEDQPVKLWIFRNDLYLFEF